MWYMLSLKMKKQNNNTMCPTVIMKKTFTKLIPLACKCLRTEILNSIPEN